MTKNAFLHKFKGNLPHNFYNFSHFCLVLDWRKDDHNFLRFSTSLLSMCNIGKFNFRPLFTKTFNPRLQSRFKCSPLQAGPENFSIKVHSNHVAHTCDKLIMYQRRLASISLVTSFLPWRPYWSTYDGTI